MTPNDISLPRRLFIMRHGRSQSNMLRDPHRLGREPTEKEIQESQRVSDPSLTESGKQACRWYSFVLPERLRSVGIDPRTCLLGSSSLLRAQQTAEELFPSKDLIIFASLGEDGDVPENTPRGMQYRAPSWEDFLEELRGWALRDGARDFVIVAHGFFIRRSISKLLGHPIPPLSNLDGYAMELLENADGTLSSDGQIVAMRFPQEERDKANDARKDNSFPAVLHGWQILLDGLHCESFRT